MMRITVKKENGGTQVNVSLNFRIPGILKTAKEKLNSCCENLIKKIKNEFSDSEIIFIKTKINREFTFYSWNENPHKLRMEVIRQIKRFCFALQENLLVQVRDLNQLRGDLKNQLRGDLNQPKGNLNQLKGNLNQLRGNWGQRMRMAFFSLKKFRSVKKAPVMAVIMALICQTAMLGVVSFTPSAFSSEPENLCPVDLDVVLIVDRSESMADGEAQSQCKWYKLEMVGPSQRCVAKYTEGLTQEECQNKNDGCPTSSPYTPIFTPATNSKIVDAKNAANSFVDLLGNDDRSSLVSFSTAAILDKGLSNDHPATQTAINALVIGGGTNIKDAIALANGEFDTNAREEASKVAILLTDGKDSQGMESEIQEAKSKGYKIFTIGLEDQIDEAALQYIADETGGQYYHASESSELSGIYDIIYNEIAWEICQYGSISGCKFNDANNNGIIDEGEEKLSDWEIILSGDAQDSQLTDENGCYSFSGLLQGNYIISEGENTGSKPFIQTYPEGNHYNINLGKGEDVTDKDFANYFPICGNGILDDGEECDGDNPEACVTQDGYNGFKYCENCLWGICQSDEFCGDGILNGLEICEIGDTQECFTEEGYSGVKSCQNDCLGWGNCVPTEWCGDGVVNNGEVCDDGENNGIYGYCNNICTGQTQAICGNGEIEGDEQCDDGENNGDHSYCSNQCIINSLCNNGLDDDNDGLTDYPEDLGCDSLEDNDETDLVCIDNDGDGYGDNCELGSDCDDNNPNINPGIDEICNNIDDNCDGVIDSFSRACYTGLEGTEGIGICRAGSQTCSAGEWGDCEGEVLPQDEICDELDNNCNGQIDEGDVCDSGSDDSEEDKEEEQKPSGGGGFFGGLVISSESIKNSDVSDILKEVSMKITWTTTRFSTSSVIYDTEPGKFDQSEGAPNYGYTYSKQGDDSGLEKVTGHSVTLTGLKPNTTYYYRAVSSASPPVFSKEYEFTTGEAPEPKQEETAEERKSEQGKVAGAATSKPEEPESKVLGESKPSMLPSAGGETFLPFILAFLTIFGFACRDRKKKLFSVK